MALPILIAESGTAGAGSLLSRIIVRHGLGPVELFTEPEQALRALREAPNAYRVAILRRPVSDGRSDILTEIKGAPELAHVPVIVMSESAEREEILAVLEAGAASYLLIPFSIDAARRALDRALRQATPAEAPRNAAA